MNGSWIENYQFQRGIPMRLADMTPEQRRYWQNENSRRSSIKRREDRTLRKAPDTAVTGGKPKKAGVATAQRFKAEQARLANERALADHKGSEAMIAARTLQTRGHVVYSLAIMGQRYGGPMANLWVVDLKDHPVPVETMIAWARDGVPVREERLAAAVPIIRPSRRSQESALITLIEKALDQYGIGVTRLGELAGVGGTVVAKMRHGTKCKPETEARLRACIAALDSGEVQP